MTHPDPDAPPVRNTHEPFGLFVPLLGGFRIPSDRLLVVPLKTSGGSISLAKFKLGDQFDEELDGALLNLEDKSTDELRELLNELRAEEQRISYRRRVLHGRIDILRAELVRRLKDQRTKGEAVISGGDIDRLIEILANDLRGTTPEPGDE